MAIRETFHLCFAFAFVYTIYYDRFILKLPDVLQVKHEQSWGRSKYLSFWNLYVQGLFFTLALLDDIIRWQTKKYGKLSDFLNVAFPSIVFPSAVIVSTIFTLLFAINRELAYPLMIDIFVPKWVTYSMHILGLPAVLLELGLANRRFSHRKRNLALLTLYMGLNLSWVLVLGHVYQYWALPPLEPFSLHQQIIIVMFCVATSSLAYFTGEVLRAFIRKRMSRGNTTTVNKKIM